MNDFYLLCTFQSGNETWKTATRSKLEYIPVLNKIIGVFSQVF